MEGYIEKFKNVIESFISGVGKLYEREKIKQFWTSLPGSFNIVRTWYALLPQKDKTYTNLKAKAIETAGFFKARW